MAEPTSVTFASWLTQTARGLGYESNAALARGLDIDQSTISRWITRGSRPSVEHLLRISDVFRIPLEPLLVLSGYVPPEAVRNSSPPEPPEQVTIGQRLILDADMPDHSKRIFLRYWQRRQEEERERLSELISMANWDFVRAMNSGKIPEERLARSVSKLFESNLHEHIGDLFDQQIKESEEIIRRNSEHKVKAKQNLSTQIPITIHSVAGSRIIERDDGKYTFELIGSYGQVVIEGEPVNSREAAEAARAALMNLTKPSVYKRPGEEEEHSTFQEDAQFFWERQLIMVKELHDSGMSVETIAEKIGETNAGVWEMLQQASSMTSPPRHAPSQGAS